MDLLGRNFSWNEPRWLALLLAMPLIVMLLVYSQKRLSKRMDTLNRSVGDLVIWRTNAWMSSLKSWLLSFAFVALMVTLSGPRLGWRLNEIQQNGMDVVVAIDVSRSMLAQDVQPSRLEQARRIILDLLEAAPGDRFGLVLFAGAAYIQCPLTFDHDALRSFLDGLDPDLVPVGGTDLADALKQSLKAIGAGGQNKSFGQGKLIVLLSDGENQQGDLDDAIRDVQLSQAKVIAVALGTESGSPVPDQSGGLLKDVQGNVVISKLDDKSLRLVAEKTGGYFVSGTARTVSVAEIYQQFFSASGVVRDQKSIKEKEWFDRYQWPAALALLFLLVELVLSDVKKSRTLIQFVFLAFCVWPTGVMASDREAYNRAVTQFEDASSEDSERAFRELQGSSDKEVARRSLYNLGYLLARRGQFDEAVKAYEEALKMNPQDQQVRDNLQWVKSRQLNNQDQQKSDQQKSDQQKSDQQKSDQQKSDQQKSDQQKSDQQKSDQQKSDQQKSDQQKSDQQKSDQQKSDQQKSDQQKSDQQKSDQQKSDQQKSENPDQSEGSRDMDVLDAERLLRSVPDEPRRVAPIYRGGDSRKQRPDRDW